MNVVSVITRDSMRESVLIVGQMFYPLTTKPAVNAALITDTNTNLPQKYMPADYKDSHG